MEDQIITSKQIYDDALELMEKRSVSETVELLKEAAKLYPEDIDLLNLLGLCQYILCNFSEATAHWEASIKIKDDGNKASYYLGIISEASFKEMIRNYDIAIASINNGNLDHGIALFESILGKNDGFVEPHIILGMCYYRLGHHKEALSYWEKGLALDRSNNLIQEYLRMVKSQQTEAPGRRRGFVRLAGVILLVAVFSVAAYLMGDKNSNYALMQLDNLIRENAELTLKLNMLDSNREKEVLEVETNYDTPTMTFEDEEATFRRGLELYGDEKFREALNEFELIADHGTDNAFTSEALFFSAVCSENLRDYDGAVARYKQYIEKFPRQNYYDDSLYNSGLILFKVDKKEEAKVLLRKLVKEEPRSIFNNSKVRSILED